MSRAVARDIRAHIAADLRGGLRVSGEDLLVATLVALPFAGGLGILVNAATGWPTPVPLFFTLVAQALLTFWIAGFRRRSGGEE